MLAPCKNCPDRYLGCHSKCEKYIEFAKECERLREIKYRQNKTDDDWWRITSTAVRKRKR